MEIDDNPVYRLASIAIGHTINRWQFRSRDQGQPVSAPWFAREFRTVRLYLGRGAGHSSAAARLALALRPAAIVCPSLVLVDRGRELIRRYSAEMGAVEPHSTLVVGLGDEPVRLSGRVYRTMILDGCRLLNTHHIEEFYRRTLPLMDVSGLYFYVLLG